MGRWQPDASGRLRDAALELYEERGFERTTVADIAERAGLTARTFFNHYADKRDVLFAGTAALVAEMERALDAAPPGAAPLDVVMAALGAAADVVTGDRSWSQRRRAVILANEQLHERELLKLAALVDSLVAGLGRRRVDETEARLAAEIGVTVFKVAFDRWATGPDDGGDVAAHMAEVRAGLEALSAGRDGRPARSGRTRGTGPR